MRRLVLLVSLTCLVSAPADGALIEIPNIVVERGTPFVDVPVMISGGESITDMSAIVFSGRGGRLTGNPPAPPLLDISPSDPAAPVFSYAGSIWEDNVTAPGGFTPSGGTLVPPSEVLSENVTLNVSGQNVIADGVLFSFRLETSGLFLGQVFELSLGEPGAQLTTLTNSGAPVTTQFANGSISVRTRDTTVPEPSSIALAALATLLTCCRRFRRSR